MGKARLQAAKSLLGRRRLSLGGAVPACARWTRPARRPKRVASQPAPMRRQQSHESARAIECPSAAARVLAGCQPCDAARRLQTLKRKKKAVAQSGAPVQKKSLKQAVKRAGGKG